MDQNQKAYWEKKLEEQVRILRMNPLVASIEVLLWTDVDKMEQSIDRVTLMANIPDSARS